MMGTVCEHGIDIETERCSECDAWEYADMAYDEDRIEVAEKEA